MGKKILVWFRNDIRIHDNEMLSEAIAKSDEILPVFIFDPRQFQKTTYLSLKTGVARAKFLLESVADLKATFDKFGGELLVIKGEPEHVLPQLVQDYQVNEVYHHREVASEETHISTAVEDALWKLKVNLKHFIGHTLYNKEDLPFPVKDIPDVFTQFKKKTERDALVKPCVETPKKINFVKIRADFSLPSLEDLYCGESVALDVAADFKGGETAALMHLHEFLHKGEDLANNNVSLKKASVFSKLSAWLSLGCISPRQVYWKMKEAESTLGLKPYFHQIVLGLLWRDYYRFMFKKYRNTFFKPKGFNKNAVVAQVDEQVFNSWKNGRTENALVNTLMNELATTGYINGPSRQLVASYLVNVLQVNWVFGAYYFEEVLIDYNPASNWGNWANVAGVGNDQKLAQGFDFEKLLKIFDPKGNFAQALKA